MSLKLLLLFSDTFPPFRVDVADLFGKKMVQRGHTIEFLLQSDASVRQPYKTVWSECKVWVGPSYEGDSWITKLKNNFCSLLHDLKLIHLCRRNKYDGVLVKDKFFSALLAILVSRIYHLKLIYWLSYPIPEDWIYQVKMGTAKYPITYFIRGCICEILMYHIIMRLSDHIFVQTDYMIENISRKGIPKERMTAVPMAVSSDDIPMINYDLSDTNLTNNKSILYIGTINRLRRIDFLLRVHKKVLRKDRDVKLIIVGGGDYKSDEEFLWKEAKKLEISNSIIITGFIPRQEIWQYAKDVLVCVSPIFPSPILDCGSPTKLLEYMALGKAVVANDHPEQKLVLSESKAGILVPYEEAPFAAAILYLLKHPKHGKIMGIKGREYVMNKRNYEQMANLVETKLLEICGYKNH